MYSSLIGPLDFFALATDAWRKEHPAQTEALFEAFIVGPKHDKVHAFNGSAMRLDREFSPAHQYDLVFVPVIFGDLDNLLNDAETIDWLRCQAERGAILCSVCAGAFLLAQTGYLDGKKATTHWNLAARFASRFPRVKLQCEKMLIDEGDCITAGGVTAYMDLSLYIASRFGSAELAATLSKLLLIDPARRLQSPYQTRTFDKQHGDAQILALQQWIEEHVNQAQTVSGLALRAGMGERTLLRRFKKATGDTPLAYLQQVRIENARKLLENSALNIAEITWRTGYEDVGSFRKLFKHDTGLSPSAYRKKFSCLHI